MLWDWIFRPGGDEITAQSTDNHAPSRHETAQSTDNPAPSRHETAPSTDNHAPSKHEATQSTDNHAPSKHETAQSTDKRPPSKHETAQSTDNHAPSKHGTAQSTDNHAPSTDERRPSDLFTTFLIEYQPESASIHRHSTPKPPRASVGTPNMLSDCVSFIVNPPQSATK
ncbi:MAG: hypothetical protein IPG58_01980 [Acidobacteria bacterium]|nr:hypothetical protein [Acidobacteriota bacterium]